MLGGIFDVFSRREGKVSKKPLTKEFRHRLVMLLKEILGSNFNFSWKTCRIDWHTCMGALF